MTKTLQEIQQENRKLIVEAEFKGNKKWTKGEQKDLIAHFIKFEKPRTLCQTLFAIGKVDKKQRININSNGAIFKEADEVLKKVGKL